MWMINAKRITALLVTTAAIAGGALLAQQAPTPRRGSPVAAADGKAKTEGSAAMAQTEARLAKLREIIRPQPGEHVTNMAQIAWQRDPWEAAVKAGKEGKPVFVFGAGAAGIACGYG